MADEWDGDLPYFPGDGTCPCGDRCGCAWETESVFEGYDVVTFATWQYASQDCHVCHHRAQEWYHREVHRTPRTDLKPGEIPWTPTP